MKVFFIFSYSTFYTRIKRKYRTNSAHLNMLNLLKEENTANMFNSCMVADG